MWRRKETTPVDIEYENVLDDHLGKLHFTFVETCDQLLPAHWHEHLEILYVTGGRITASINEGSYELEKGDIFLVNSNDIHYTHTHGDTTYFLLQIPPVHLERISANWKSLRFRELFPAIQQVSGEDSINEETRVPEKAESIGIAGTVGVRNESGDGALDCRNLNLRMEEIFRKIAEFYEEKREGYHLLVLAAVYQLLFLLYTEGVERLEHTEGEKRSTRDLERVKKSMEFAREHYGENISLSDVAGILSITPEHFCRLFRKYTGQTFLAYVNQIRMEHFYRDLLETNENITFLLEQNGLFNYKGFLKRFKERYGMSPKEVRKKKIAAS